jgi:LacI family transcriptional regulator
VLTLHPLPPWDEALTSRDVAKLVGVSQATVSRVLADSPLVSAQTRKRVKEVLEQVGYQPNAAARTMRSQRSGTVGVVVESLTNPFYPELLRALGTELQRCELQMILWDADESPGVNAAVQAIEQRLVDGLLFTTATESSEPFRRALQRGAPLVLVNRTVDGCRCDQVGGDNERRATSIARYFAQHGRDSIAMVGGPAEAETARQRMRGFRAGASEAGLSLPEDHIVDSDFSHDGGQRAMQRILSVTPTTNAVFCANDVIALGALDAIRTSGRIVPDDVWVVGYDDIAMASWAAFDLTTARQPLAKMARSAVDMLRARIDTPNVPFAYHQFWNELIVRDSTGHAPFDDHEGVTKT